MPEVDFTLRWPDGALLHCTSPSRAIEAELTAGASYPVHELVRRTTEAMAMASERVRARYGFACTAATAQAAAITDAAAAHATWDEARVVVESIQQRRAARRPPSLGGHVPVVVVGGGQAGLSASWFLCREQIDHVVLEADRAMHRWQSQRWDSFSLVTPNWQCRLPGHPYDGDDPDGFMVKEELLGYLDRFRASFDPPLREGVRVTRISRDAPTGPGSGDVAEASGDAGGRLRIETTAGTLTADQVIVAVGGYHDPVLPPASSQVPAGITQLHTSAYRSPHALPDGAVLVVGTGQSGAQIAEDLHLAGRQVHLAVGTAPRVARRHRGRDVVAWLHDRGWYDMPIDEHPEGVGARKEANHYVTGRDGGHDLDLRTFALEGMQLHGRLERVDGGVAHFAGDLAANLDGADDVYRRINEGIDTWIAERGIDAPPGEPYVPVWQPPADHPRSLDLAGAGISTVIWATGFRPDWSWVDLPWLDAAGDPVHERGVTSVPGLHVLGLPWLHTWGSGRFASVARDAEHLVARVTASTRERVPTGA